MTALKTGDPCPCCGQPIKTKDRDTLRLLSWISWKRRLPSLAEIEAIMKDDDDEELHQH